MKFASRFTSPFNKRANDETKVLQNRIALIKEIGDLPFIMKGNYERIAELQLNKIDKTLSDRAATLDSLGFTASKGSSIFEDRVKEINYQKSSIEAAKKALVNIDYYSEAYPQYTFLTYEYFQNLTQKYDLGYASSRQYLGEIPDQVINDLIAAPPLKFKELGRVFDNSNVYQDSEPFVKQLTQHVRYHNEETGLWELLEWEKIENYTSITWLLEFMNNQSVYRGASGGLRLSDQAGFWIATDRANFGYDPSKKKYDGNFIYKHVHGGILIYEIF